MTSTIQTRDPQEVLEKYWGQEKVILSCSKHLYTGPGSKLPPYEGCKDCAHTLIYSLVAGHKGHKGEALDELEAIIHAMVELDEEGLFDYVSEKTKITTTQE